jgi:hypothetical protein
MLPHALLILSPGALAELPALMPGLAAPETLLRWKLLLFYPFTVLHLIAPANSPWLYFDAFHCLVAATGVYLATLRWTGDSWGALALTALVLPFGASGLAGPNAVAALTWTPWLWLLAETAFTAGGRDLAICGALAAVQLLAGCVEVVLLSWVFMAICATSVFTRKSVAWRLRIKRMAAFALLMFLLAATQVVPIMDLPARLEFRPGGTDVDFEQENRPVLVEGNCRLA